MSKKNIIILSTITIIIIGLGIFAAIKGQGSKKPLTAMDNFAKCLTDKGYKLYGAEWCPHCQNQKKLFGEAAKYLNYIECSTNKNPNTQSSVCKEKNITGYPTWELPENKFESGEKTLQDLANSSKCTLPN